MANRVLSSGGVAGLRMRSAPAISEGEETVLVAFTGTGTRTVPFPGGYSYRFGEDEEHRIRRVRKEHAPRFMNHSHYRIIDESEIPGVSVQAEAPTEPEPELAKASASAAPSSKK